MDQLRGRGRSSKDKTESETPYDYTESNEPDKMKLVPQQHLVSYQLEGTLTGFEDLQYDIRLTE